MAAASSDPASLTRRDVECQRPPMGTYHTFFVAADDELDRLFPGWKPVHAEPARRGAKNPFTNETQTIVEWVPVAPIGPLGKPSLYDDVWGPPVPSVEVPTGPFADYAEFIERQGPPGLRALPHFRSKNLEPFYDFDALVGLLFGRATRVPPARLGEGDDVPIVFRLPRAAAERLLSLDGAELRALVAQWLVETDLSETGDTGEDAQDAFIAEVLAPFLALCRTAQERGAEVCHYYALHH